tara:strand:+ start:352 stop:519 length:168 start_codon:yes stop_codon:yes gene_type:complete
MGKVGETWGDREMGRQRDGETERGETERWGDREMEGERRRVVGKRRNIDIEGGSK